MLVNLKSLNESLENLCESSLPLNERFNDSFPDWLKDRLVTVKNYHHGGYDKRKNIPYNKYPAYINARGEDNWNPSTMSLFDRALGNGVDLTQLEVYEGSVPEKRTDERLHEPNVPIWLFDNGQVYIEGINDNEIYKPMDKAFKYIPMKYKIADAKGFAYYDSSKVDTMSIANKQGERRDRARELKDMGYGRRGKDPKQFIKSSYYGKLDKSGYLIDPDKYKNELAKIKAKNIYQELDNFHDKIADYKIKIQDAWSSTDMFGSDRSSSIRKLTNLMSDIDSAAGEYNKYCTQVEDILSNNYLAEQDKLQRLGNIITNMKDNYYLNRLKENGADIFLSEIDWD